MSTLSEFSVAELERELERRKIDAENEAKRLRKERNTLILEHRDVLLQFIEHGRTSCGTTDNSYHNEQGFPRCNRCALERLEEWNLEDYEISLELRVRYVENR